MSFALSLCSGKVKNISYGKTQNGTPVLNFELEVLRKVSTIYKNTFRVSAFGNAVSQLEEMEVSEGDCLWVLARLQTEGWTTSEGVRKTQVKLVYLFGGKVDGNHRALFRRFL